jgi:hypothetical protein
MMGTFQKSFDNIHFMTTKAKLITAVIVAAGVVAPIVLQRIALQKLESQTAQLMAQVAQLDELEALRAENRQLAGSAVDRAELERLRGEHLELLKLRGEIGLLRDTNAKLDSRISQLTAKRAEEMAQARAAVEEPAPAEEQNEWISTAARLRNALLSGQPLTDEELQWLAAAKPAIEQMEREPALYSDFQTTLIKETVGTLDQDRLAQIRKVIADTYQQAVAGGLDLPSKPAENYEAWVERRHALDRAATAAVQGLLSAEEREVFDRRSRNRCGQRELSARVPR